MELPLSAFLIVILGKFCRFFSACFSCVSRFWVRFCFLKTSSSLLIASFVSEKYLRSGLFFGVGAVQFDFLNKVF